MRLPTEKSHKKAGCDMAWSSESGAAFYEAAIGLPLFVFMVFLAIGLMALAWAMLSVQFTVSQTLRQVVTGMCGYGPPYVYCEDLVQRLDHAKIFAQDTAVSYGLPASIGTNLVVCIFRASDPVPASPLDQGLCNTYATNNPTLFDPGELLHVRIEYKSTLLQGALGLANGTISSSNSPTSTISASATGRVEVRPHTT